MSYAVIDVETTGLNPRKDKTNIVGIKTGEGIFKYTDMREAKLHLRQLKKEGCRFVFHNGKFDARFIWKDVGIKLPIHEDTMILGYLLYSVPELRQKGTLTLKKMAQRELGKELWDISLEEKTSITQETMDYLDEDLNATGELLVKLKPRINRDPGLLNIYKLLCRASSVYMKAEMNGLYIDKEQMKKTIDEYTKKSEEIIARLKAYKDINYNSPQQLRKLLYEDRELPILVRTDKGDPSTNALSLSKLAGLDEIVDILLEYRRYTKALTFLKDWEERLVDEERLYPSFHLTSTVTGRTSCSNPNIQQVPRDSNVKSLFTAPKGWKFIQVDYSQMELRIAGEVADVKALKRAYQEGLDVHAEMAKSILNKDEIKKSERSLAKPVNFGFLYGMSAKAFPDYAKVGYGQEFSLSQAEIIRSKYFSKYSELPFYYEKIEMELKSKGSIRTLFGRVYNVGYEILAGERYKRRAAIRAAINATVQGPANDIAVMAIVEIDHVFKNDPNIKILGSVHDSILFEIKEDEYFEERLRKIKSIMEKPKWLKYNEEETGRKELEVPIVADIEVGPWGSGKELTL